MEQTLCFSSVRIVLALQIRVSFESLFSLGSPGVTDSGRRPGSLIEQQAQPLTVSRAEMKRKRHLYGTQAILDRVVTSPSLLYGRFITVNRLTPGQIYGKLR